MARTSESFINFVLREPNGQKATPIVGIVRFNNSHLKVPTGFTIEPEYWNSEKGRVRNVVAATLKTEINNHLNDLDQAANEIIPDLKAKRISVTKEIVRERIKEYFDNKYRTKKTTQPALFLFIEDFIEKSPQRVNVHNGKHVEKRTIQKYQTVYKVLKEFSLHYKHQIDFDTIDLGFYDAFVSYLTNEKKFAVNNVGKYIQTLKVFLNEASFKGIDVKQDYRNRKFKVCKEDSDNIFFNESELKILYQLDLSKNKRLEKIRDLFLAGCYTGLRFSDLINLRPEYITGNRIRLEQFKTLDKVVIPCHPIVKLILNKYNNELPRSISNQKMNDYLKELCELANFVSIETKSITKGGKRLVHKMKKFEMVSTHTARRSFASNMFIADVPTFIIMKITGHKTEKAFMKYIKLDKEQYADKVAERWEKMYSEIADA